MLGNSVSPVSGAVRVSMSRWRAVRVASSLSATSPDAAAASSPPAASSSWNQRQATSASSSVKRSTYHEPPAGSTTSARCDSRDQDRLRVAPDAPAELGRLAAAQVVVGEHGDGIGAGDPGGEAGDGRPQRVHPRVVARHHRRRRDGVDRRRSGGVGQGDGLGDAGPQTGGRRGTWRSWRTGRRWRRGAARCARTTVAGSTPRSCERPQVADGGGDRGAELAARRTPRASWKRVPSTVTTWRSGRSSPSRVNHPARSSSSASGEEPSAVGGDADRVGPERPGAGGGVSPARSNRATRASRHRPSGARRAAPPVPGRAGRRRAERPARRRRWSRRRSGRAGRTWRRAPARSRARPVPAAASTSWRTSQPSAASAAVSARRPRTNGGCPGAPAAPGSGRVLGRVQRFDGDAVVRGRAQAGHRRVGRQPALAVEGGGDGGEPPVAVCGRELPGEHEFVGGRRARGHALQDRSRGPAGKSPAGPDAGHTSAGQRRGVGVGSRVGHANQQRRHVEVRELAPGPLGAAEARGSSASGRSVRMWCESSHGAARRMAGQPTEPAGPAGRRAGTPSPRPSPP